LAPSAPQDLGQGPPGPPQKWQMVVDEGGPGADNPQKISRKTVWKKGKQKNQPFFFPGPLLISGLFPPLPSRDGVLFSKKPAFFSGKRNRRGPIRGKKNGPKCPPNGQDSKFFPRGRGESCALTGTGGGTGGGGALKTWFLLGGWFFPFCFCAQIFSRGGWGKTGGVGKKKKGDFGGVFFPQGVGFFFPFPPPFHF